MAMPSVTVMVVNSRGVPPAAATPRFADCAWRESEMLQGAASFQVVATPTIGCVSCSSVTPIAYKNARCGARSGPEGVWREGSFDLSQVGLRASSGMVVLRIGTGRTIQSYRQLDEGQ